MNDTKDFMKVPIIHKTCGTEIYILMTKDELEKEQTDKIMIYCVECKKMCPINKDEFFFYPKRAEEVEIVPKSKHQNQNLYYPNGVRGTNEIGEISYRCKEPELPQSDVDCGIFTREQIEEKYTVLSQMGSCVLCCEKDNEDNMISFYDAGNGSYTLINTRW